MNTRTISLALIIVVPSSALATPPQSTSITIDCRDPVWPTLREVADRAGYDVANPPYLVRRELILDARRACRRGAANVLLSFDQPTREPTPALTRVEEAGKR